MYYFGRFCKGVFVVTELQILSAIKNNGGSMEYTSLLNLNMTDHDRDTLADKTRVCQMLKDDLLDGTAGAFCTISISDKGRLYLQNACYLEEQNNKAAEQVAKDRADQDRQNRFLRITTIVSLGIAAMTAATTLLGLFVK